MYIWYINLIVIQQQMDGLSRNAYWISLPHLFHPIFNLLITYLLTYFLTYLLNYFLEQLTGS